MSPPKYCAYTLDKGKPYPLPAQKEHMLTTMLLLYMSIAYLKRNCGAYKNRTMINSKLTIRHWNAQTLGTSLITLLDYFSILREISAPFVDRTSNARRIQEDFASAKCHPLQFVLLAKENKSPIRADRELPLFHDWAQNPWANVMRNDNAYNTIHAKPGFIHIFKKTIS